MKQIQTLHLVGLAVFMCTASPAFAATVTYVGQEDDVRDLRTTTVAKAFDPDGDDVYGEDGYVFYAVDDPPFTNGTLFTGGDPLTLDPSPFVTLSSIPPYLDLTSNGQDFAVAGFDYPVWDRIGDPPGAAVADVEGGLALNNNVSQGTEASVLDITVVGALPPAGVRIGVYLLFSRNDFIASARLDSATGTTAATPTTSVAHFFDLTAATVGETVTLYLTASALALNPNVSYVGLTFDAIPLAASLAVTKTASPTELPEPGGAVTFTVRVDNTGAADVELTGLVDDVHGDLDGQGTCSVPQTLSVGGFYECSFSALVSGAAGDIETDTVTADGTAPGGPVSSEGSATVTITEAVAATEVPTLSPALLLLLAVALGGIGALVLRRLGG